MRLIPHYCSKPEIKPTQTDVSPIYIFTSVTVFVRCETCEKQKPYFHEFGYTKGLLSPECRKSRQELLYRAPEQAI